MIMLINRVNKLDFLFHNICKEINVPPHLHPDQNQSPN